MKRDFFEKATREYRIIFSFNLEILKIKFFLNQLVYLFICKSIPFYIGGVIKKDKPKIKLENSIAVEADN